MNSKMCKVLLICIIIIWSFPLCWAIIDNNLSNNVKSINISVNLSSNTTKACRSGGTCTSSENMGTYTRGDYFGVVPGAMSGKEFNITAIEVWRTG